MGFKDFTIRLNHRQVLTGILDQAGVPREKHDDALIALDKMDKAGPEGVARELRERGIVDESAVKLMRFFEGLAGAKHALDLVDLGEATDARAAYNADVLGRLVEFIGAHEIGASGVDDLRQMLQLGKASGVDSRIKPGPTLARGLAYYTGSNRDNAPIFQARLVRRTLRQSGRMFLGKISRLAASRSDWNASLS